MTCVYIYKHTYVWSPPHDYEALLLYCQHNLLHAGLFSEEPKTLEFTVFSALRTMHQLSFGLVFEITEPQTGFWFQNPVPSFCIYMYICIVIFTFAYTDTYTYDSSSRVIK